MKLFRRAAKDPVTGRYVPAGSRGPNDPRIPPPAAAVAADAVANAQGAADQAADNADAAQLAAEEARRNAAAAAAAAPPPPPPAPEPTRVRAQRVEDVVLPEELIVPPPVRQTSRWRNYAGFGISLGLLLVVVLVGAWFLWPHKPSAEQASKGTGELGGGMQDPNPNASPTTILTWNWDGMSQEVNERCTASHPVLMQQEVPTFADYQHWLLVNCGVQQTRLVPASNPAPAQEATTSPPADSTDQMSDDERVQLDSLARAALDP